MENASKALIMAGSTLIALLVAGLIAYSISTYGSFSKDMNAEMENSRTAEFNSHFLQFDGRADITADEIITTINFAKYSNDNYELYLDNGYEENKKSPYFVDMVVERNSGITYFFDGITNENGYQKKIKELLEECNENNKFYMCNLTKVKYNGTEGTLTKVLKKYKPTPDDITIDSSAGGTGRVTGIKFLLTKTPDLLEFDPTHRDQFLIE